MLDLPVLSRETEDSPRSASTGERPQKKKGVGILFSRRESALSAFKGFPRSRPLGLRQLSNAKLGHGSNSIVGVWDLAHVEASIPRQFR